MYSKQRVPFHEFCNSVLKLKLTPGQEVVARVVFGDDQIGDLPQHLRELAVQMLGGDVEIPDIARKCVAIMLGRGSGKTTISSAYVLYEMFTADLSKLRKGDLPIAVMIAPNKPTARIAMRMLREFIRSHPNLEGTVTSDRSTNENEPVLECIRPDGRTVACGVFAAASGGKNVRGRPIITALLDEACFFRGDDDSAVSDQEVYRAITPRLLGKAIFISTPWPSDHLMGKLFEANFGHPDTALAVRAPTTVMRTDSKEVMQMVAVELKRDPDNAKREFFCDTSGIRTESFFENIALEQSVSNLHYLGEPRNPFHPVAVGVDWAFSRDSSTCCVIQFDGTHYRVSEMLELKPKPGQPLKPSEVVREFAEIAKRYGVSYVVGDDHYREALKEHLQSHGLGIISVPGGITGKALTYSRTRSLLHDGKLILPSGEYSKRLIQQAGLVVARPSPGGNITIRQTRRTGLGHGDLVSAWVAAVHHLAYSEAKKDNTPPEVGTPERMNWEEAKRLSHERRREEEFRKRLARNAKARSSGWA